MILRNPSRRFEWTLLALATWLTTGSYLDAWAHRHVPGLETFFTPYHAVLYSGMFAVMGFLGITALRNQARGESIMVALPPGYGLSLVGCILFAVGGSLDLIWHQLFGIERDIAALLSPTHLLLMGALALIVTGPLRSGWHRPQRQASYPVLVSSALLLSMLTFFGQFDQPFVNPWAASSASPGISNHIAELGILGIIFQTALVAGVVLFLLRRFTLPFGSLAILFGLNGALLSPLEGNYDLAIVAILGGLLGDVLFGRLKRGPGHPHRLRVAAFLIPASVCALYLVELQLTRGLAWKAHLIVGAVVIAGGVGWLLSYLAFPPAFVEPLPRAPGS